MPTTHSNGQKHHKKDGRGGGVIPFSPLPPPPVSLLQTRHRHVRLKTRQHVAIIHSIRGRGGGDRGDMTPAPSPPVSLLQTRHYHPDWITKPPRLCSHNIKKSLLTPPWLSRQNMLLKIRPFGYLSPWTPACVKPRPPAPPSLCSNPLTTAKPTLPLYIPSTTSCPQLVDAVGKKGRG